MDFRESDSSDNGTDREMCEGDIDLRKDVGSDEDDCDGTTREEDYWFIPLPKEDAEDILKTGDKNAHDTVDDLSKIGEGPDENSGVDAGLTPAEQLHSIPLFAEPSEGMLFDSWEHAYKFYNVYAMHVGFSVRIQGGHKDTKGRGVAMKDRPFVSRLFVCSKEGFRRDRKKNDEDGGEHGFQHMVKRTGCQAMLSVKKIKDSNKWTVIEYKKDHNHVMMSPEKRFYLRSHRKVSNVEKRVLETGNDAAMRPDDPVPFPGEVVGGPQNHELDERQRGNALNTFQKRKLSVNNTEAIYKYCQQMSIQDPTFFYAIQNDNKGRMTNFFWVDGRGRTAYNYFGDVVTFDTTYRNNKYKMPFALFTGVNHHCKNILFGCALLQDETEATFIWLFRIWLRAMSNHPPVSITTDQDAAMNAAIKKVFPGAFHRFSLWYILRKFSEHFSIMYHEYPYFKSDLHKCFYKTYSEEQFEMCWREFVQYYKIEEHPLAKSMYAVRKHWVPAYLRDTFFAAIRSRQQSESTNWVFSRVLKPSTTSQELINNYKMVEDKWYEEEIHLDCIDIDRFPNMKTQYPIEKHAATVYTKEVFDKFQTQLFNGCGYMFQEKERDGVNIIYIVRKHGEGFRPYKVTLNPSDERVTCSCRMFEYSGILCRHVLNILLHHQFLKIPSHYILKRWTKDAKKGGALRGAGMSLHSDSKKATILRFNDMIQESKNIAQEACESDEKYEMVMCRLKRISDELASSRNDSVALGKCPKAKAPRRSTIGELLDESVTPGNRNILLDPLSVPTNGEYSGKKPLSGIEMATSKSRKCKICQNFGHNRRSCPVLKEASTMDRFRTKEPIDQDLHSDDDNDGEPHLSLDIPDISPSYQF